MPVLRIAMDSARRLCHRLPEELWGTRTATALWAAVLGFLGYLGFWFAMMFTFMFISFISCSSCFHHWKVLQSSLDNIGDGLHVFFSHWRHWRHWQHWRHCILHGWIPQRASICWYFRMSECHVQVMSCLVPFQNFSILHSPYFSIHFLRVSPFLFSILSSIPSIPSMPSIFQSAHLAPSGRLRLELKSTESSTESTSTLI